MTELSGEGDIMLSYHGDPAEKAAVVAEYEAHRAADTITQGRYWDGLRGCLVGCLVHSGDHGELERRTAVPRMLWRLADRIHEGLPHPDFKDWPPRFASAIPVGADLSRVGWRFLAWLLRDLPVSSVTRSDVRAVVDGVATLMDRLGAGEAAAAVPQEEILAVRRAAAVASWAAAEWATEAAARAAWVAEAADKAVASAEAASAEAEAEAAARAAAGAAEAAASARAAVSGAAEAEAVARAEAASAEAEAEAAARAAAGAAEAAASAWAVSGAAEAASATAARENAYRQQADKLLSLLAEAAPA